MIYLLIWVIMGCQATVALSLNVYFYLQNEKDQSLTTQVKILTVSVLNSFHFCKVLLNLCNSQEYRLTYNHSECHVTF